MGAVEAQLDPQRFARIHRSTIVNLERIRELQPYFNREYIVVLKDGTKLKLSRSYRERLDLHFGGGL
jgi:two-component system LytT family response regulator